MNLNDILSSVPADAEAGAARIKAIRELLPADASHDELVKAAMAEFDQLQRSEAMTPEILAQMSVVADFIDAAREAKGEADAAAADIVAQAAALNARVAAAAGDQGDGTNGDSDGDGGAPAAPEPAAPAAPATAPAAPALVGELIPAASGGRIPLGRMPKDKAPTQRGTWQLHAAADIRGFSAGQTLTKEQFTMATDKRLSALASTGPGKRTAGIAELHRDPHPFVVNWDERDEDVLALACNESRLPNGSLVAAGGWCAPSTIDYNLCDDLIAAQDGMVDLPRVSAPRGGLRWPTTPDFAAIYAGTGFCYTEAEIIAQVADKPCYEIGCNTFNECRLGVCGVCVKVPILTERGYPELVRYTIDQVLAAHAHRMNMKYLATMEAKSTAVTIPVGAAPFAYGPGATATALGAVELQIEYLRYKRRLGMDKTMQVILPAWSRGIFRSDLAKRNGVDMLETTNEDLRRFFAIRGAIVSWVLDWQDAFSDTDPPTTSTKFGGATAPLVWPNSVKAMIFPAGTFFLAEQDVISIDGLYDSALLARNMHLALFTEQAWCVDKRCGESIVLTMNLCPNGETGRQVETACPAA